MSIKHIYYQSRQKYENQRGCYRTYFNQVRYDKNSKFEKVSTKHFSSLIDEMKFYSDREYICAGLNSHERECVIIDRDSEDFGKYTFQLLKQWNILPHFIKVKPNGHSQFFFFIEKFNISKGWFEGSKHSREYHEEYYPEEHTKWKRLIKLMNVYFGGDVGFTGYNCQNPFYNKGDITVIKPLSEKYTVNELFDKMNDILSTKGASDYINQNIENFYKKREQNKVQKIKDKIVLHFKDEELSCLDSADSILELKLKLEELLSAQKETISPSEMIDEIIKIQNNSINKRIFVCVSQVCKSFHNKGTLHDINMFDEIIYTCLKNWKYQDEAVGYSYQTLLSRIKYDINEIKQKDLCNSMLWDKVGYTTLQREKSLQTRRCKMTSKRTKIYKLLNKNSKYYSQLSFNKIAEILTSEYNKLNNDNISLNTVKRYLMIKFRNNIFLLKKYINKQELKLLNSYSYIHNNKLVTAQKKDVVKYLFCDNRIKNYDIFAIMS